MAPGVGGSEARAAALTIYTLGTSNRSREEFLALLAERDIRLVADVRRFPKSKLEHFARDSFRSWLQAAGIDYVWLGDSLGGYRKGGYESHMQTPLFRDGLMALEREAWKRPVAAVCAEKLPWLCHRRHLCKELVRRGWKVIHLVDPGRIWQDSLSEQLTIAPPPDPEPPPGR
jgi:uncharacterized protein (DUF488 family)